MKLDRTHFLIAAMASLVTALLMSAPDVDVFAQATPPAAETNVENDAVAEETAAVVVESAGLSGRGALPPLPKAFVDRCLEVAEQIDPQFAEELRTLCELDSAEFERIIRRQGPRLTGLVELKLSDPILFDKKLTELKADAEVQSLAITLRRTMASTPDDTGRIKSLRAQLRGHLIIRLGFELDNQRLYIERIEKQLEMLKRRLVFDRKNFNKLIEQQLAKLSGSQNQVQAAGN